MSLTVVKGLQSEIFVPVTPPPVWAPVKKELKDMSILRLRNPQGKPSGSDPGIQVTRNLYRR